ncbi:hypothetical protein CISG_08266 [Coccidioides immitis RMSCC 3703]|nr:hypothetical protein CISG_08266 [Coccidioides immitis RMSCC 3703]
MGGPGSLTFARQRRLRQPAVRPTANRGRRWAPFPGALRVTLHAADEPSVPDGVFLKRSSLRLLKGALDHNTASSSSYNEAHISGVVKSKQKLPAKKGLGKIQCPNSFLSIYHSVIDNESTVNGSKKDLRIEDANNSSVRSIPTSAGITSKGDGDSRDQIPLGRSDGGFLGAAGFRHWPGLPALSADDLFPDSSRAAPKQGYR